MRGVCCGYPDAGLPATSPRRKFFGVFCVSFKRFRVRGGESNGSLRSRIPSRRCAHQSPCRPGQPRLPCARCRDDERPGGGMTTSSRPDRTAVSIIDVAHLAGVSRQTVSNVVNERGGFSEETRSKVLRVIAETGYKPNRAARQLRTNRSRHIGFPLHTGHVDPRNPFTMLFLKAVADAMKPLGHSLIVVRVRRPRRGHLPLLGPQRRDRRLRLRPGGPRRLPHGGAAPSWTSRSR